MKLYTAILEKFIDLPTKDPQELRALLDDVGLEVKNIDEASHGLVFTIETLANRGDHTHSLGIARELSARLLSKVKHPPVSDLPDRKGSVPVRRETPRCMRYALLEMTVPQGMPLRDDIAAVLGAGDGKRHAIVDILNYTSLELGQPMHAFDKDKIEGEITIDLTSGPVTVEALDGKQYSVPPDSIVIRDKKKIVAVAGIIGCANSMVTSETSRVLIESASFEPISIRKTARSMGISTDASYTFERGCDINMVIPALKRAVYLLQGGNDPAHLVGIQFSEGDAAERRVITVRLSYLKKQINLPRLPDLEVTTRLKNLGYGVEAAAGGKEIAVSVPSWRLWDVSTEEDIIEDFIRSHGLNNVRIELPPLDYEIPPVNESERVLTAVEPSLAGNGFLEVITRSFYSNDDVAFLQKLDSGSVARHITLKNSIESEYSHLKATNVLHFASLASQNHKMHVQSVKVFEYGRLFSLDDRESDRYERDTLCMAVSGRWYENEWRKSESTPELMYLMKGIIESLLASLGRKAHVSEGRNKFLHPGYQGAIISGRETLGFFGVIHPLIKARYELKSDLVYAELDGSKLAREIERPAFMMPVDYPNIRRDITLRIQPHDFAGRVLNFISGLAPDHLSDLLIVDDFKKESEDYRRVTYRLTFQHPERTLENAEIESVMQRLLAGLKEKHGLELAS